MSSFETPVGRLKLYFGSLVVCSFLLGVALMIPKVFGLKSTMAIITYVALDIILLVMINFSLNQLLIWHKKVYVTR